MIRFLTTALLCLSLPGQALALSCMQWDAAYVYQGAAEAEERYVIAYGSFQRTGPDRATGDNPGGPSPFTYSAHFTGNLASRIGFHTPADFEVELQVDCISAWCGSAPEDGQMVLAFMQVDDNRQYSLALNACPFWAVTDPDQEALDQITACMRGGC